MVTSTIKNQNIVSNIAFCNIDILVSEEKHITLKPSSRFSIFTSNNVGGCGFHVGYSDGSGNINIPINLAETGSTVTISTDGANDLKIINGTARDLIVWIMFAQGGVA